MPLHPNTLLVRQPGLRVVLSSPAEVEIEHSGAVSRAPRRALAVLDVFAEPTPFERGLESLTAAARGRADGLEIVEIVFALLNRGLLRRADGSEAGDEVRVESASNDELPSQVALLDDTTRTTSFLAAIAEVVRPGDVVLDLGTGTGILAVAAARAGARRVYAVESGRVAAQAAALFATSGFGDRITLLRGWSQELTLPEPADVLICELIGNDPLDERIVDTVSDARRRLLKDRARFVPSTLDIFVQAFQMPAAERETLTFGPAAIERWRAAYGLDYEPVRRSAECALRPCRINPAAAARWPAAGDPVALLHIDLAATLEVPPRVELRLGQLRDTPDALLLFFESQLSPSVRLSTAPAKAASSNSWVSPMWLLPTEDAPPETWSFRIEARRRIVLESPRRE